MSGTYTSDEKVEFALKTALFRTMQSKDQPTALEDPAPPRIFPNNIMKVNLIQKGEGDIDEDGYYVGRTDSASAYLNDNNLVDLEKAELVISNYRIIDPSNNVVTNKRVSDLTTVNLSQTSITAINALPTTGTDYPKKNWFFRGHYGSASGTTAFNNASSSYDGLQLAWDKSTVGATPTEADIVPHLKFYLQVQTKYTNVAHGDNISYAHDLMKGLIGLDQGFTTTLKVNRGEGGSCTTLGNTGTAAGNFWFTQATSGTLSFYGVGGTHGSLVNASDSLSNLNSTKFPMISYIRYTGETGFGAGTGGGGGSVTLASADSNVSTMIGGTAQTMTTTSFNFDGNVGIGTTSPDRGLCILDNQNTGQAIGNYYLGYNTSYQESAALKIFQHLPIMSGSYRTSDGGGNADPAINIVTNFIGSGANSTTHQGGTIQWTNQSMDNPTGGAAHGQAYAALYGGRHSGYSNYEGEMIFYTSDTTNRASGRNLNPRMTIKGGNVGIGTTSPNCKLDVNYPESWTQHSNSAVRNELAPSDFIASFRPSGNNQDAFISIRASGESNNAGIYFGTPGYVQTPNKAAIIAEGGSGYSKSKLHFCLATNSDNNYGQASISATEGKAMMTIDAGNVGIGTTSPAVLLDVNGHGWCRSLCVGSYGSFSTIDGGDGAILQISNSTYNASFGIEFSGYTNGHRGGNQALAKIICWSNDSNNYENHLLTFKIRGWGTGGGPHHNPLDDRFWFYGSGNATASAWNTSSDDRVKHNERNITNAMDIINKLNAKLYFKSNDIKEHNYDYELDNSGNPITDEYYRLQAGFIAQEVREIPELEFCVEGKEYVDDFRNCFKKDASGNNFLDENNEPVLIPEYLGCIPNKLALGYNDIFVYNVVATQELDRKVIALESENAELKTEVATLKSELAAIKQHLGI